jgi:hypothetical protein
MVGQQVVDLALHGVDVVAASGGTAGCSGQLVMFGL